MDAIEAEIAADDCASRVGEAAIVLWTMTTAPFHEVDENPWVRVHRQQRVAANELHRWMPRPHMMLLASPEPNASVS